MGPEPRTEPARHRGSPAHLPRQPPPDPIVVDSPAASPAKVEAVNQADGAGKKKVYTPHKVNLLVIFKAPSVAWQEVDDPTAGGVYAGRLGGILRDKLGAGLAFISDAELNHPAKFTIVGVKAVDYDKGMKLTRHHIA